MADDRRRDDARPGDPAEGVRIIGAEEAAEAIERGDVAERRGTHLPRYGDRPARPPAGPKPALRFPLEAGVDAETPSLRPAKGQRFDPRPPPAWDEPEVAEDDGDPWPAESTWGDAGTWHDDPQADVVAWTRGETGAQPVVPSEAADEEGLSWAEDFVDEDDPWDGSWDEPTGAVRWADDEVETVGEDSTEAPRAGGAVFDPSLDEPVDEPDDEPATAPPAIDLGAPAAIDLTDTAAPAEDDWAAFGSVAETPRRGRGLFGRRRSAAPAEPAEPAEPPRPAVAHEPADLDDLDDLDDLGDLDDLADLDGPDDATQVGTAVGVDAPAADLDLPDLDASQWAPPADDSDPGDDDDLDEVDVDELDDDHEELDELERDDPAAEAEAGDDADEDDEAADAGSPWGEPSWGAEVVSDDTAVTDAPSSPLFDADGGWVDDEKVFDFADEPSGQVALPHWTEPGTGELPRILAGDDAESGPTSGSTSAVHWRSDDSAWTGDEDFADLADDDDVRLGALDLDRPHDDELYAFDELDDVGADPAPPPPTGEPGGRRIAPARPVPEAGSPTGGAGRNLGVATAVGIGAATLAIVLLTLGSGFALILVVAILVVGMGEFQAAAHRAGYRPASLLGLTAAALYPVAVYWRGIEAYPVLIVITVGAALAWHLLGVDGDARVVESVGVTLFGVAWIAGLGSFAGLLLAQEDGRGMLVTAILAAVGYDVGGLIIGRTMGTRPISDASPNKTLEGLLGGVVVSMFTVVIVVGLIMGMSPWGDALGDIFWISLFAALAAPLGDLCESLVKRDLGVKDMGNLLPEHGGILDRFDGLLFVLPTVFFTAMLFDLHPF